ncbi:hypothetical protein OVA24_07240 [Luteolibacter sp. SL250]|uniref:hypothetical protein n=1 Tax=Luteolibacter sp. SL250 TaxID=2995170 RepID=UPI002271E8C3|nr:hypothetical protein [Luteolibacter sp. SL250]WAC21176.1 hypothetical protein OVA24_07240 [Luteolibacter sp. SL250]
MSRRFLVSAAIGGLLLGGFLLTRQADTPSPPPAPNQEARRTPPPPRSAEPEKVTRLPIADGITPLNSPDSQVEDDLATIELLMSEFRKHHDGNPVGENEEITAALLGGNPKRLAYLPDKGPHLNGAGQLIDRWGTPYFFHQISGSQTEIRSAGPDREMNTADDHLR